MLLSTSLSLLYWTNGSGDVYKKSQLLAATCQCELEKSKIKSVEMNAFLARNSIIPSQSISFLLFYFDYAFIAISLAVACLLI